MGFVFIGTEIFLIQEQMAFYWTLLLIVCRTFASFAIERIIPHKHSWNKSQGDIGRDTVHFLVNETTNYLGLFLMPLMSGLSVFSELWPKDWFIGWQLLFAVVVFDFFSTVFHYLCHKNAFLWRFHAIHHAPTRLYGFNGIMKHPAFQLLDGLFALGPLVIIGIPQDIAFALIFCIFTQLLIQHTNADVKTGLFRMIFATAEVHRFHHLKGKAGDVNFALFFSFWDRILRTAYFEQRAPLEDNEIGISNTDYPKNYWGQIKKPFELDEQPIDSKPLNKVSLVTETDQ